MKRLKFFMNAIGSAGVVGVSGALPKHADFRFY